MAEIRRLHLRFNLENPLQQKAWKILFSIPSGHRTESICHAVVAQHDKNTLKEMLREVVHEELKHTTIQTSAEVPEDDAVLGFLRALQEGGDEP